MATWQSAVSDENRKKEEKKRLNSFLMSYEGPERGPGLGYM